MDRNTGFTLIELMLVVTIIGVLAAIAIPAYQDYTGRAQVTEAFSLAGAQKLAVTEYHAYYGAYPPNNSAAGISSTIQGAYVQSVQVSAVNSGIDPHASITATMKSAGISKTIQSGTLVLKGWANGSAAKPGAYSWACNQDAGTTIENRYLPATCRE